MINTTVVVVHFLSDNAEKGIRLRLISLFFFSFSALLKIEIASADAHYSERLVRFRGLGAYFYRPAFFRGSDDLPKRGGKHDGVLDVDSEQVGGDDQSRNQKEGYRRESGERRGDTQQGASQDGIGVGWKEKRREEGDEERVAKEWRLREDMRKRIRDSMNLPQDCRLYLCPQVF